MTSDATLFEGLRLIFERLARLAAYAAGIEQRAFELGLIAIAIEHEHREGDDLMSVAQVLKDASAQVRQSAADVKAAIDAAIARLSDNPTAADIGEVVANLTAAGGSLADATAAAGTIDPDDTSGGVVDDGSGGVVEPTP